MRAPSRHGAGKCVGVGVPNTGLDAFGAEKARALRLAREADPKKMHEFRRKCAFNSAKAHAKKDVTLPTFNFLKGNDDD